MFLTKIKICVMRIFVLGGLLQLPNAYAENYLFPTDIVDKGRFDVQAGYGKFNNKQDIGVDIPLGVPFGTLNARGSTKYTEVAEFVGVRYGFADSWHLAVVLPHLTVSREEVSDHGGAFKFKEQENNYNKNRNLELSVKHRFIGDSTSPFSLTAAVIMAPSTANRSYSSIATNVSAGWRLNDSLRTYVGYNAEFYDREQISDMHSLLAGAYKQVSKNLTLVPHARFNYFLSSNDDSIPLVSFRTNLNAGLSAQWQLFRNTYLIPDVSFVHTSDYVSGSHIDVSDSNDGRSYSLSLYHLF